jgi:NAD(P)-dependent dehydrogenase (short-subunit alcohol dehydrogenase family)
MNATLTDQVAIVTGASRGIGAATARAFAAAGATVALAARDAARLEQLAAEIEAGGGTALSIPTDIGDPHAIQRMVARTLEAFGRLDIAFNNAAGGGHPPTPLTDVATADFESALAINLRGTFLCLRHEIAAMLESGGGAIVNMTSTAGLEAVGGLAAYVSTKHGIVGLTKVAALEYAARGIRVNAVAPGPILTEQLQRAGEAVQQGAAQAVPMRRIGRAGKLAGMAPFARQSPGR